MILPMLSLSHVAASTIGNETVPGITEGESRRLALGRAFVTGAQVIFCDRPTNGLNATDEEVYTRTMRLLAKKANVSFVAVIDQPGSRIDLFDNLLLMTSRPARAVYNGAIGRALYYFDLVGYPESPNANPADHFVDTVSPDRPGDQCQILVEHYIEVGAPKVASRVDEAVRHPGAAGVDLLSAQWDRHRSQMGISSLRTRKVPGGRLAVGFWTQLRAVGWRKMILTFRDCHGLAVGVSVPALAGVVVGFAFFLCRGTDPEQTLGLLFSVMVTCSVAPLGAIRTRISEHAIMREETADALYSGWVFFIASSVVNLFVGFIGHLLLVNIAFVMAQLDWELYASLLLWATLCWWVVASFADMLAVQLKDADIARSVGLLVVAILVIWNGFTTTSSWSDWIRWCNPIAYAVEAVAVDTRNLFEAGTSERLAWDSALEGREYGANSQPVVKAAVASCGLVFRALALALAQG
jgi:hypothetical protein